MKRCSLLLMLVAVLAPASAAGPYSWNDPDRGKKVAALIPGRKIPKLSPDTLFLEFIHQLIKVSLPSLDEPLFSLHDKGFCYRIGTVLSLFYFKTDLICKGVHKPGLTLCQVPDGFQDLFFKYLSGLFGVLKKKNFCLFFGEISEP